MKDHAHEPAEDSLNVSETTEEGFDSQPSKQPQTPYERRIPLNEIRALLGEVALVPVLPRKKKCIEKGWQKLTAEQTKDPEWEAKFEKTGYSVGVSLGIVSCYLVSIDFDTEEAWELFVRNNPHLEDTLTTRGGRGANAWFRIKGDYPKNFNFKHGGEPAGEWRADGRLTVVRGIHESGNPYRILNKKPPLLISYKSINWGVLEIPERLERLERSERVENNSSSSSPTASIKRGLLAQIEGGSNKALEQLKENKELWPLYQKHVEQVFTPQQGARNNHVVAMVSFLALNVSPEICLQLSKAYYEVNSDVFDDSLEAHMKESTAHQENILRRWKAELTPEERELIEGCDKRTETAFRITRQLAIIEAQESPHGHFYISHDKLGKRIGIASKQAGRILGTLVKAKILTITENGTQTTIKERGRATRYQWTLSPLPKPQTTQPTTTA